MAHVPTAYEIETASGRYVDVYMPRPETITLEDIAHGLAHTCRFGGHTSRFYSVAEHAVIVADKVIAEGRPGLAFAALHHDDHEAYLGDIPRPIKLLLDRFAEGDFSWRELEDDLDRAIHRALSWEPTYWQVADLSDPLVKDADLWAMMCEARALLPSRGDGWLVHGKGPQLRWPVVDLGLGLRPATARHLWLERHHALTRRPVPLTSKDETAPPSSSITAGNEAA